MNCCFGCFRRIDQRSGAFKVSHGREFHRRKVQACTIQTHGSRGHKNITDINVFLNCTGGADTQECADPQLCQFFHRDRGGRAADTG